MTMTSSWNPSRPLRSMEKLTQKCKSMFILNCRKDDATAQELLTAWQRATVPSWIALRLRDTNSTSWRISQPLLYSVFGQLSCPLKTCMGTALQLCFRKSNHTLAGRFETQRSATVRLQQLATVGLYPTDAIQVLSCHPCGLAPPFTGTTQLVNYSRRLWEQWAQHSHPCLLANFLAHWKSAWNSLPAVFQKVQPYPGKDLNPDLEVWNTALWPLSYSSALCSLSRHVVLLSVYLQMVTPLAHSPS